MLATLHVFAITGKVVGEGKPLDKVVVTDGTLFTQTDAKGNFQLDPTPGARFIYISTPAGYMPKESEGNPKYYYRISDGLSKPLLFDLKSIGNDNKHYFFAFGDPQVRDGHDLQRLKDEVLADMTKRVKGVPFRQLPNHVLVAGDLTFDRYVLHPDYIEAISHVGIPFYNSIGNHDHVRKLPNDQADSVFCSHYGPTRFSFNRGNVHYVGMDNINYKKGAYDEEMTSEELEWLRKDLSYVSKSQTLVITLHSPVLRRTFRFKEMDHIDELIKIVQAYKMVHFISGHIHVNSMEVIAPNIFDHNVGAASGNYWRGVTCKDGTPIGYQVFEVNGDQLKWYFQTVDRPSDFQFKVYPPSDRNEEVNPNHLIVSVWNWDVAWKVECSYDGGKSFNAMTRCMSCYDPDAYLEYGTKDNPKEPKKKYVIAEKTDHVFLDVPPKGAKQVIVKVTDRFGEVFKKVQNL